MGEADHSNSKILFSRVGSDEKPLLLQHADTQRNTSKPSQVKSTSPYKLEVSADDVNELRVKALSLHES